MSKFIVPLMIKAAKYLYLLLLIVHLFFLYIGKSSVITTFLLYLTIGIVGNIVIVKIYKLLRISENTAVNSRLFVLSTLVMLLLVELFLRYVLKEQQTYMEVNGSFYTQSPYRQMLLKNLLKNYACYSSNCHIYNRQPFKHKVDTRSEFKYESHYNSIGFRDTEPPSKPNCNMLIMGLGDSFTEGVGTHQDSTWLKAMEYRLYDGLKQSDVCTFNGGSAGNDPFYEYVTYKKLLSNYKPDLVILNINKSDIGDIIVRGGMERFQADGLVQYRPTPMLDWFCQFSFICRHLAHTVFGLNEHYYAPNEYRKEIRRAKNEIYTAIKSFQEMAQAQNFTFLVVFHPIIIEFEQPMELEDVILKLNADTTIITINLREEMMNSQLLQESIQNVNQLYWPIDLHNNPAGYRLWGQIMADCLMDYEASGVKIFPDASNR